MPLLLTGLLIIAAGLFGWSLEASAEWLRYQSGGAAHLFGAVVVGPLLAAWIAAEMVQVITPRRLFARRRRTRAKRFILGLAVGLFSAASATVALPWADRILPDALVFGLSAALWMAALLACCPRIRPGHCIHCGYDLRQSPAPGQPGAGRCPECGTAISPLSTGNIPIPSVP